MIDILLVILLIVVISLIERYYNKSERTFPLPPAASTDLMLYRFNKHQYLNSPEWKTKRQHMLKQTHYTCQMCGTQRNLHIHHISYKNLYREPDSDLAVVCANCHSHLHAVHGFPQTLQDYETFHGPLVQLY